MSTRLLLKKLETYNVKPLQDYVIGIDFNAVGLHSSTVAFWALQLATLLNVYHVIFLVPLISLFLWIR
jgi:hypothetical protein